MRGSFLLKILRKNYLRTIPASAEEKCIIFSI